MTSLHSALLTTNLHEAFHYVDSVDPGAVGAGKYWLDTTSEPYIIKRRNGTNTDWIQVGGSGSGAAVMDGAQVSRATNQSIPDATPTKFVWSNNFWDVIGDYTSGTTTQLILAVGVTGYFHMYAQIRWGASAAGSRTLRIIKNSTDLLAEKVLVDAQGDDDMDIFTHFIMANGDFVELELEQNSGGALDIVQGDFFSPIFGIRRMGN